ncbi:hypothetical protein MKQ70_12820 [Chitinophaga sedimenti]|uniref:hypothetical protein n=1 Tax=Chitinophaga sedimenti TaxID=2033606 RepID=UPI002002B580|nr:hypothetical protein [Chitinophaga sedimenti]MCK7555849.1 hypothetical protein [Chitinophaga sedimenti]
MKHLFYVIGCLLISTTCFAQQPLTDSLAARMRMYAPKAGETAIYLRCNKDVYMPGEDLWFSAFVLHAQAFTLSGLDKILYVQLSRRDNDSTIWQEMYPIEGGLSSGHIYLPDTLSNGDYLLKGYSAHSFFGRKYFYAAAPITIATKPLAGARQCPLYRQRGVPIYRYAVLLKTVSPSS